MSGKNLAGGKRAAGRVVDPQLPKDVRAAVCDAPLTELRASTSRPPKPPPSPWPEAILPIVVSGVIGAVLGLLHLVAARRGNDAPSSDLGHTADHAAGLFSTALAGAAVFVAAVGMAWAMVRVLAAAGVIAPERRLARAHGRYILTGPELNHDARRLLTRAQQAITSVLGSRVYDEDLVDARGIQLQLAAQEWGIAQALRDHTRLARSTVDRVAFAKLQPTAALDEVLAGITRRVEALEGYAAEVDTADRSFAEWREAQELRDNVDQLLDLLARTARDELAVVEVEELTGAAAALAQALRSARDAAVKAQLT